MRLIRLLFFLFFVGTLSQLSCQENDEYLEPINDPSADGQRFFVQDLLDIAGYVPEKIQIYQTLPNQARVFRVKLDSVNGGFVFVRWDKVKKENFVANKMIDPGVYFNLKAAKEIMRKQTDKANFSADDVALQAPDQEPINSADLDELRAKFDLKNEEKRLEQEEDAAKQKSRRDRKENRKEKKQATPESQ
ncbi:hypothetical protein N9M92_05410 [Flavobacteriaceae bacterium]|nr:hypothetical protein [Flavobacteriaceae bacterium]